MKNSLEMTRFFTLVLLCAAFLCSSNLFAQNPIISIQGTLKDANGASIADSERSVTFRLYDVASGGTALWEETAMVNVIGGIYSHNLGSVTPLVEANFATTLYLGVEVGGLELSPRTEMTYAPYALSVASTQKVAQGGCSGQVGDIKYSILNPTQFAEQNGDCWVPMDGRAIPGTALEGYGYANVPDMSGLFIRATEYNDGNDPGRSPMAAASLQGDELGSHNHSMQPGGLHSHGNNAPGGGQGLAYMDGTTTPGTIDNTGGEINVGNTRALTINDGGEHTHAINNTGGDENRPKNMNFYIYIRVD